MSRFLVTGGCGFIGSHLVDALVARGHTVVVVDNLSSGKRANIGGDVALVIADVACRAAWAGEVGPVDGMFHMAAVASVEQCNTHWVESHRTNVTGTLAVLEEARSRQPAPPVVYASSAAVYGDQAIQPVDEECAPSPLSPYGVDKFASELHCRAAASLFGIRSAGMRFFNVYGPRQDASSPYAGVISIFLDRVAAGLPVTIHGDGSNVRDFVYVQDVVECLVRTMELLQAEPRGCAQIVNVGTGEATSIRQLLDVVSEVLARSVPTQFAPPRRGDIRASIALPARLRALLGTGCDTSLPLGLRLTVQAARRDGAGDNPEAGE